MHDILTGVVLVATTNVRRHRSAPAFESDPRMTVRSIVAGQFLGVGSLALGSTLAAMLALVKVYRAAKCD